ncbi:MAG: hypothetical protein ACI9M6_000945, partial [Hydrogenophaga sp.]
MSACASELAHIPSIFFDRLCGQFPAMSIGYR